MTQALLSPTLGVSAPPSLAIALYDLLDKRRALAETRRFDCADDQDLRHFHDRIVCVANRAAALEAIALAADEYGGGIWLAHALTEIDVATSGASLSRDDVLMIVGAAGDGAR